MKNSILSIFHKLFKLLFLGYLAILPMSHSTALRNLLLLVLVFLVLFYASIKRNQLELSFSNGPRQVPIVILAWISFLFLFPLWAVQPDVAWVNLRGQWVQSILAWIVGFGAVLILGKRGPSLWALALSSFFAIAVHLLLFITAWAGILTNEFYAHPSITSAWNSIAALKSNTLNWQQLPVGFLGVEPLHFNLGHTACQAIILFGVCFFISRREGNKLGIYSAIFLTLLCFASLFIAESRGAILFGVFIILFYFIIFLIKLNKGGAVDISDSGRRLSFTSRVMVVSSVVFLLFFAFKSVENQERWYSMSDKVRIGLLSEKPINILCEGVSPQIEAQVREFFSDRNQAYIQVLLDGLKQQDGGRILLMRAGIDLVLENPGGLDGSKQSYQKLIKEKCGHEPVLRFSHAHQGWINLALALGWIGVLLFACLLVYFLRVGWANLENLATTPWAMGLFIISAFWILRGFSDEVYREHYLQMQALVLAYLFWRLRLAAVSYKDDGNS
jgi:hypothetical protein